MLLGINITTTVVMYFHVPTTSNFQYIIEIAAGRLSVLRGKVLIWSSWLNSPTRWPPLYLAEFWELKREKKWQGPQGREASKSGVEKKIGENGRFWAKITPKLPRTDTFCSETARYYPETLPRNASQRVADRMWVRALSLKSSNIYVHYQSSFSSPCQHPRPPKPARQRHEQQHFLQIFFWHRISMLLDLAVLVHFFSRFNSQNSAR